MVNFMFHFRDNTNMEIIKRHDLLEAYLQAGLLKPAKACAPKRLIYFYYAQWRHSQWGPRGPDPTKISEADFKYFVQ